MAPRRRREPRVEFRRPVALRRPEAALLPKAQADPEPAWRHRTAVRAAASRRAQASGRRRQPAACRERRVADRYAASASLRLAVAAWAWPEEPVSGSRARHRVACRRQEAGPSAGQARWSAQPLAARPASALPSVASWSDVPAGVCAAQPSVARLQAAWSSARFAMAAAVAEEAVSPGAWERPPGEAAGALAQPRAAAEAVLQASAVAQPRAAVALRASAEAALLRAAVVLPVSAEAALRRAAAGRDAPAERRQAALPSAAASCPCRQARVPAPTQSVRSVRAKARLRIASR